MASAKTSLSVDKGKPEESFPHSDSVLRSNGNSKFIKTSETPNTYKLIYIMLESYHVGSLTIENMDISMFREM